MKRTLKNTLKKVFVLLLAVGFAFSAYGCKKGGKEQGVTNGIDNITVVLMNFEKSQNDKAKDENA